ncbi:MAG: hypothetical protein ABSG03_01720 [Bryobacteraceae bacterium]
MKLREIAEPGLLFVVLHFDWFQVFGLKYLTTIQAFEIIDAIPAGNNLGTGVIARSRHIQRLAEVYFKRAGALVKPFYPPCLKNRKQDRIHDSGRPAACRQLPRRSTRRTEPLSSF